MNRSAEDYIKTIYILKTRTDSIRSVDVARELGYSKASVSLALSNLRKRDIIIMKKDENYVGCIELKNGEIIQAYGPCNRTMTGETKEAYDMWLKKHTKLMKSGIKYGKEKVHMRVETMQTHYINMYNKYCKKQHNHNSKNSR